MRRQAMGSLGAACELLDLAAIFLLCCSASLEAIQQEFAHESSTNRMRIDKLSTMGLNDEKIMNETLNRIMNHLSLGGPIWAAPPYASIWLPPILLANLIVRGPIDQSMVQEMNESVNQTMNIPSPALSHTPPNLLSIEDGRYRYPQFYCPGRGLCIFLPYPGVPHGKNTQKLPWPLTGHGGAARSAAPPYPVCCHGNFCVILPWGAPG